MKVARCRSCRAPMVWCVTVNGKNIPIDEDPDSGGVFILDETREPPVAHYARPGDVGPRFTSHFATCPDAVKFRKKEEKP